MEIYRLEEGPFSPAEYEVTVHLNHPTVPSFRTYKHCNLPLMGVGPKHQNFMYFDKLIDKKLIPLVRKEVLDGYSKGHTQFRKIIANGLVPKELNKQKTIDSYLANLDKYATDERWKSEIQTITRKGDLKSYFHQYFGVDEAWDGIAMFRDYTGLYEDKGKPSQWMKNIEHFPALKSFVESLPFKYVGYAMIFKSKQNQPVLIHRDYFPVNHQVNFMNIKLDQRVRPFFLYDLETHTKKYLAEDQDIYFFNEIDLHGMDPEAESGLTLRVEGQFTDEFKTEIGLADQDTFNWNYEKPRAFLKSGQFKIEQSTDI